MSSSHYSGDIFDKITTTETGSEVVGSGPHQRIDRRVRDLVGRGWVRGVTAIATQKLMFGLVQ